MPLPPSSFDINSPLNQFLFTNPIPNTLLHVPRHIHKIRIRLIPPKPHKPPPSPRADMFIPPTLDDRILQGNLVELACGSLDFGPVFPGQVHVAPGDVGVVFAAPDAETPARGFGDGVVGGDGCYIMGV